MATYTNRKASQALRGEAVLVTCNEADVANFTLLRQGQLASMASSGNTGTVGFIDSYGVSFQVIPIQPDRTFESGGGVYGYLAVGEVVTVST